MSSISITKLYALLVPKLGRETSENLTNFIEEKIRSEMESNTHVLATKEDLAALALSTKADIAALAAATKADIAALAAATKADITALTVATKTDIAAAKADIAALAAATKADIAALAAATKADIATLAATTKVNLFSTKEELVAKIDGVEKKMVEQKADIIKWMFLFWIGQAAATFASILLFLKK